MHKSKFIFLTLLMFFSGIAFTQQLHYSVSESPVLQGIHQKIFKPERDDETSIDDHAILLYKKIT